MSGVAHAQTLPPASRNIASGPGWSFDEFVCVSGPGARPFEECHDRVSIAVVVAGTFTYASDVGRALLHPGALLLGNHGACYECEHDHGRGDRCLSVRLSPEQFQEIAATAAGSSRFRFPAAMLPADRAILSPSVMMEVSSGAEDRTGIEERLLCFVAAAVRALSGASLAVQCLSAADARRVSRAVRYIEQHAAEPLNLDRLASVAAASKFHFLRIFRRATGLTPYQFLLNTRLRRAAVSLLTGRLSVSALAYESGFGDLSTFNAAFRARFGTSPQVFRRNGAATVPSLP